MSDSQELKSIAKTLRVLYVEDEDDAREHTADILKLFFNHVALAKNGKEALDFFSKEVFDLVITDLTMPVMDGIEMLEHIYMLNPKQHVIVTTAHNDSDNLMSTINMQVDGFLLKPVELSLMLKLFLRVSKEIIQEKGYLAGVDHLTKETNFSILQKELSIDGRGVVLVIVIDGFSKIHETFGKQISQWLIKEASAYLKKYLPDGCNFYSLRWNEYALYFNDVLLEEVYASIQRYYEETRRIVLVSMDKHKFRLSFSYGAIGEKNSILLDNFDFVSNKIKNSDIYEEFYVYNVSNDSEINIIEHLEWLENTITALNTSCVEVDCQPMVRTKDRSICGYEALARITTESSRLEPALFLEPSNRAGILEDVTRDLIKQTLSSLTGKCNMIFINIGDFWHNDFDTFIISQCNKYSVAFEDIILDVRSQVSFEINHSQVKFLLKMKELGFKIAIEHFENNLINTQTFFLLEPEFIKIELKKEMDKLSEEYIKSVIKFTDNFNIATVAMGIESEQMFEKAKLFNFTYAMGYHISKPIPLSSVEK